MRSEGAQLPGSCLCFSEGLLGFEAFALSYGASGERYRNAAA
jgi:hypothetical protein